MIGKAILRDVASSAAARVTIHIDKKARMKPLVGLKTGGIASRGGRFVGTLLLGSGIEADERLLESVGEVGFSAMSTSLGTAMRM